MWHKNSRTNCHWLLWKNNKFQIGQMHYCSPLAGEWYYLCLLLTVCTNTESFELICTIKGTLHSTFQAVCVALGLLENDGEWINCFEKAGHVTSDKAQCVLFVCAILQKSVLDSLALWNQFVKQICDNLKHAIWNISDILTDLKHSHLNYNLYLLNEDCLQHDWIIAFFDFLALSFLWGNIASNNLIQAELTYNPANEAQKCDDAVNRMNSKQ